MTTKLDCLHDELKQNEICPSCGRYDNKEIVERLDREIKATESILREGDPFLINRQDYLNNLKEIQGTLTKRGKGN